MIAAVVLAAGSSRRMGRANKLLLNYRGRPLIRAVVETLLSSQVHEIVVVTGHDAALINSALDGLDVVIAHNVRHDDGLATSRRTGIQAARPDAAGYMICLADLPCLGSKELDQLIGHFLRSLLENHRAIVRPAYRGHPGHPIIFAAHHRSMLLTSDDGRTLVQQHATHLTITPWDSPHVVQDVDTPEDYRRLCTEALE